MEQVEVWMYQIGRIPDPENSINEYGPSLR
jgi:hypothetical protein